jgi:hypothetical protein
MSTITGMNKLLYQLDTEWYDFLMMGIVNYNGVKHLALCLEQEDDYQSYVFLPVDDKFFNREIDLFTAFKSCNSMYLSNYIPSIDLEIITIITGLPDRDLPKPGVYYEL